MVYFSSINWIRIQILHVCRYNHQYEFLLPQSALLKLRKSLIENRQLSHHISVLEAKLKTSTEDHQTLEAKHIKLVAENKMEQVHLQSEITRLKGKCVELINKIDLYHHGLCVIFYFSIENYISFFISIHFYSIAYQKHNSSLHVNALFIFSFFVYLRIPFSTLIKGT